MHRFVKLLIFMLLMSIATIVFPVIPAQAQTRAELSERLNSIEDKFDRLIELQEGQVERWRMMEAELERTQQRLTQLESENRLLKERLTNQIASRSRQPASTIKSPLRPTGSATMDRRKSNTVPIDPSPYLHSTSPRGEVVLIFRNGKAYKNVHQPDGTWLLQLATVSH